jgi:multidrug efflux pump subunit AcrB
LLVPSAAGASVPLATLVRSTSEPSVLRRANRKRAVAVWFRPAAPLTPASRAALRRRIDAVPLPPGVELVGGP